jgi:hypothetical protein
METPQKPSVFGLDEIFASDRGSADGGTAADQTK